MRGYELLYKMELVDPAYLDAAEKNPALRRHRWVKYGLVAACLCAALLLSYWGAPTPTNAFLVNAYAVEIADDGTIELKELTETDLLESSNFWVGQFDGENFYLNIGLRYGGSNIKSVDFITEDGFFAKQYIESVEVIDRVEVGEKITKMVVTEFEIVGNRITLNDEMMTDDLLLFWGTQAADRSEVPEHIEMKAIATFNNGQTQEVIIPIDLPSRTNISFGVKVPETEEEIQQADEEIQRSRAMRAYYASLPLEQCELLAESVETVTDVYEVNVGNFTTWITDFDRREFDENGIYREGFMENRGYDGTKIYIPVLKRDESGVYTGMIYRVPENLWYPGE